MNEKLQQLRAQFPDHQISYLPKGGANLAYVGHAALTNRLLDTDPAWNWEPLAMSANGLPAMDDVGGMWIKLTVCGVTRLGYGHAGAKKGGDAIKEVIGDALRNAAMRFGAALDLWHKGDLIVDPPEPVQKISDKQEAAIEALIEEVGADKVAFLAWVSQMAGYEASGIHDLPASELPRATAALEKKRKQKETQIG